METPRTSTIISFINVFFVNHKFNTSLCKKQKKNTHKEKKITKNQITVLT
jgi:hypothetical protein